MLSERIWSSHSFDTFQHPYDTSLIPESFTLSINCRNQGKQEKAVATFATGKIKVMGKPRCYIKNNFKLVYSGAGCSQCRLLRLHLGLKNIGNFGNQFLEVSGVGVTLCL